MVSGWFRDGWRGGEQSWGQFIGQALANFSLGYAVGFISRGLTYKLTSRLNPSTVWRVRAGYAISRLSYGGINALSGIIDAVSHGESYGWKDVAFNFGLGASLAITNRLRQLSGGGYARTPGFYFGRAFTSAVKLSNKFPKVFSVARAGFGGGMLNTIRGFIDNRKEWTTAIGARDFIIGFAVAAVLRAAGETLGSKLGAKVESILAGKIS
jgi:hypothetical protein